MAGLYIHIPFCRSRCAYCGFYSSTRHELRQRYVDALCREMGFKEARIDTIYLGGGTPSLLTEGQLRQLFIYINKVYDLAPDAEVTIECNPDDVTDAFAALLTTLPVNRVSMGAQTFSDERLRFLRRRHIAEQVPLAVKRLRQAGIGNISIDLMYGFPNETINDWHRDIDQALALKVEHISAYALMYEEDTPLYQLLEHGTISELDEELSLQMYNDLIDRLTAAGYEHYEISNFAKTIPHSQLSVPPSYRSRHNSSYWNQTPYIGLGAAAHSYDGLSRSWNIDDVERYIEGIERGEPVIEHEVLSEETKYNELILTTLRTSEGLPLYSLSPAYRAYCLEQAQPFLSDGQLRFTDDRLILTRRGLFVSNMVMSQLMKV